jgi:hypothetical protein
VVFEIATVLILRAHYTMDVFAGIVAALWVKDVVIPTAPEARRCARVASLGFLGRVPYCAARISRGVTSRISCGSPIKEFR